MLNNGFKVNRMFCLELCNLVTGLFLSSMEYLHVSLSGLNPVLKSSLSITDYNNI